MLKLKQIKKDYVTSSETVNALKGVSISFRKNEFVSILGPSGCGKTTLLNIIGGLDHYTDGDLVIGGRSTKEYKDRDWDVYRNHRVGFIFQSYNLIPHQTVLGNVELALTIAGVGREERIARSKRALDRVGLAGQYYKRPNQLSGGQCQRVAIARALVNDPEILLADEPTGALDTVTSVQIMELIKDIAGERLVIMVTHNPELAEKYSTRIIRLLDGEVVEDTNPMTEEEEERELALELSAIEHREEATADHVSRAATSNSAEAADREEATAANSVSKTVENGSAEAADREDGSDTAKPKKGKKSPKRRKEKAKMSFFTAFRLSARNLISKKGRTTMVGIAGSIGIVGIAMVLAFSAGIKGYVSSMQDDMLSGNPIDISETGFNSSAMSEIMSLADVKDKEKLADKVYITSVVENLAEMSNNLEKIFSNNTITREYVEYVKAMPEEAYRAMLLGYGIDVSMTLFTDFTYKAGDTPQHVSVKHLINIYSSVLKETDYASYSSFIPMLVPSMTQAPSNPDYLLSQYDLLGGGKIAEGKNEIMLVLNPDEEISDLLLAAFGYYTQEEFLSIVSKATADDQNNFPGMSAYREYFDYDELIGKKFVIYPTDEVFKENTSNNPFTKLNGSYDYLPTRDEDGKSAGLELTVVGILTPKENVSYGSLSSGIYYTKALTDHIIETNAASKYINDYLLGDTAATEIGARTFPIPNPDDPSKPTYVNLNYSYITPVEYRYDDPTTEEDESIDDEGNPVTKKTYSVVSPTATSISPMNMMGGNEKTLEDYRDDLIRNLGGNDIANRILIYPVSFDDKDLVTSYLDKWSDEDAVITVDGKEIPFEDRAHVTYTDTLELVINMINTMIDVISYALIAFTSISLVVSTVMIGIITYVSVVERVKEIGVIRSLGGRKRDVSHLFNAETFIIGLLAGLIGIGFTYFASFIANLILEPLINYSSIAALPFDEAILLVILSVALTLISGLIPASSAAKKDPVVALRTE